MKKRPAPPRPIGKPAPPPAQPSPPRPVEPIPIRELVSRASKLSRPTGAKRRPPPLPDINFGWRPPVETRSVRADGVRWEARVAGSCSAGGAGNIPLLSLEFRARGGAESAAGPVFLVGRSLAEVPEEALVRAIRELPRKDGGAKRSGGRSPRSGGKFSTKGPGRVS